MPVRASATEPSQQPSHNYYLRSRGPPPAPDVTPIKSEDNLAPPTPASETGSRVSEVDDGWSISTRERGDRFFLVFTNPRKSKSDDDWSLTSGKEGDQPILSAKNIKKEEIKEEVE